MSDLTTDEVRDTWVDNQLVGIPTAHVVRLVPGLQIHFDRWLGRERQQARHEVLADLRAKVEGLRDEFANEITTTGERRLYGLLEHAILTLIDKEADRG